MSPTLLDGDIVITIRPRTLRAGFIYVVSHSDLGRIIKRLSGIDAAGYGKFTGDNPAASTPPAVLGRVEPRRIERRVIVAYRKGRFWRV